jgi:hypothetical protein
VNRPARDAEHRRVDWLARLDRETAYHEAGHVVAYLLAGCGFDCVELCEPEDELAGAVRKAQIVPSSGAFCCLAGPAAAFILTGKRSPKRWLDGNGDWALAELCELRRGQSVRGLRSNLEQSFCDGVVPKLREHWSAVEAIADELLRRRRLSYGECVGLARLRTGRARGAE